MAKFRFGSKKGWKKILTVGLGLLLTVGAIFGVTRLSAKADETTKEISLSYEVGGLSTDGKYMETEESIYTKTAFECQGLKITPDFDSSVSYQIFFYDFNEKFLESTSDMTEAYEGAPLLAKYARIEIMPQEDEKVSWYEVRKYSKQLSVEVNKTQKFDLHYALTEDEDNKFKGLGYGFYNHESKSFVESESAESYFFDFIDVSKYTRMYLVISSLTYNNEIQVGVDKQIVPYVYRMSGVDAIGYNDISKEVVYDNGTYVILEYDVSSVASILGFIDANSADCCGIYLF